MAEYNGYLAPWTDEIVRRYKDGERPVQIADDLAKPVKMHYEQDNSWKGYVPYPTGSMVTYILRRVGVMAPPPPIPIKFLETRDRDAAAWRWYTIERMPQRIIAERLGCSPSRVNQIIHRHRDFLIRKETRENRERANAEIYGPPPPPRILGRPRDMGGPRGVWLEKSPWDDL